MLARGGLALDTDPSALAYTSRAFWAVGAGRLLRPRVLASRSWADAVLAQQSWNSRVCLSMVLAAMLLLLEAAFLEAEERREPDATPLLAVVRPFAVYFALRDDLGVASNATPLLGVGEARVIEALRLVDGWAAG